MQLILGDSGWYTASWVLIPLGLLALATGAAKVAQRRREVQSPPGSTLERLLLRRRIDEESQRANTVVVPDRGTQRDGGTADRRT